MNESTTISTASSDVDEGYEFRRKIFHGLIGLAILYASMGMLMILVANIIATMPLNTPDVFNMIGRVQHIDGIRFGTSFMLFLMAFSTVLIGWSYMENPRQSKWAARIMAILHQPWLPLACIIIAALWVLQASDPGGEISEIFAPLFGLDVSDPVNALQYQYIMSTMPSLEFLMFGIGCLLVMPFSWYSSAVLLQDTGATAVPANLVKPGGFDRKNKVYTANGLIQGGVFYAIIGVAVLGIGYVLGMGIDITWPLFKLENYKLFMSVYPIFPIAFGGFCIVTGIAYTSMRDHPTIRIMAWVVVFIQAIIPVIGWFFLVILARDLWLSGEGLKNEDTKKQFLIALIISVAILAFSIIFIIIISA